MTTPPATEEVRRNRRVWIVVVAAAVVTAAVVAAVVLVPVLQRASRIDDLGTAADPNFKRLVGDDDPGLDDALARALHEKGRPFQNRVGVAKLLLARGTRGFAVVERALRGGDADARIAALAALQNQPYFERQVLATDAPRVREVLLEWLRREGDPTRKTAVIMVLRPALRSPEALAAVRAIVAARGGNRTREETELRRTAVDVLRQQTDCGAAEVLLEAARSDPDPEIRLRSVQALATLHRAKDAPCASVLPEPAVREVVYAALAHPGDEPPDRALRQGAMAEIARTPAWGEGKADAIRARLATGIPPAERRQALETLVAMRDPAVVVDLPRYFHDPEPEVRNSAASTVSAMRDAEEHRRYAPLLVGYVAEETSPGGMAAFQAALNRLHLEAGSWVGFPPTHDPKGPKGQAVTAVLHRFMAALYKEGQAEGTTRASVALAWFRHHAARSGLDAAGVDAAVAQREAFWARARAGDVAGARTALEGEPAKSRPDLFAYERGWVAARS